MKAILGERSRKKQKQKKGYKLRNSPSCFQSVHEREKEKLVTVYRVSKLNQIQGKRMTSW